MPCSNTIRSCVVVFSCFSVRVMVGGFWPVLGLLFLEWRDYFTISTSEVSLIGSICTTILWTTSVIASALSYRVSFRFNTVMGGLIAFGAFMATSVVASSLSHIFATFGVLGFGMGLTYLSAQSALVFNFDKHLGVAQGLANTGTGIGLFVMPPLFQYLLDKFGWRGCMLIASGLYANLCVCGAVLRPTPSERQMRLQFVENTIIRTTSTSPRNVLKFNGRVATCLLKTKQTLIEIMRSFDFSLFFTNVRFVAYCICGLLTGMCYTPTLIYIAPRAVDVGLSKLNASYVVSIVGIFSVLGRFLAGVIVECHLLKPSLLCGIAYAICGVATLVFEIGHNFGSLAVISVMIGLSSGVYNCLSVLVGKQFVGLDKTPGAFAWFLLTIALAGFPGVYVSGYLYDVTGSYQASFLVAGVFSIMCAIVLFTERCLQPVQDLLDLRHSSLHKEGGESNQCDQQMRTLHDYDKTQPISNENVT